MKFKFINDNSFNSFIRVFLNSGFGAVMQVHHDD